VITVSTVRVESSAAEHEAVHALMSEYAALPHTAGRWLTKEADLAALPHPFVSPDGALLLASMDGRSAGCGALRLLESGVGEIRRMYVSPVARGKGVGAALLAALLQEAAVLGSERVRLDTAPELTEARALYGRFGFTSIPPYREGLLPDALCLERAVSALDLPDC
jgi:putative acetyltransferase